MSVKPWDLFNPQEARVSEDVFNERLNECSQCPKAKLENATCPLGKWAELEII